MTRSAPRTTRRSSRLNATRNDLSEEIRERMCTLLNERLADAIDLMLQCKQAHWNVKGPQFIALHELFDQVYTDVSNYVDLIAERAVQLGGMVEGTVRSVAKRTALDEYPGGIVSGPDHVAALADVLSAFGTKVRDAIDDADDAGDADTADIFTEVSRGTDKWLWMVEAHLG